MRAALQVQPLTRDTTVLSRKCYEELGWRNLEKMANSPKTKALLRAIKPIVHKNDRILDLACGYGRITLPLASDSYSIEGIDITPSLIVEAKKRAKKQHLQIIFRTGTMTKLPYKDASFDVVLCLWSSFACLLTSREQQQALKEMVRVLKSNGRIFIENRNGELKSLQKKLPKGTPRVILDVDYDVPEMSFLHDRNSFRTLCKSLKGLKKYTVRFMNIGGERRLIMILQKR